MAKMICFYHDVLGFEIKESEDTVNVYLTKDDTLLYRTDAKNSNVWQAKNMKM